MAERTRILIAETDAKAASALSAHLKRQGYEVVTADEAINTLRVAREARPDVAIVSGQLAGGGALVALRRLRSNVFTTHIPVIAVVGKTGAREKELVGAGAQECLSNPVDPAKLSEAVERHCLKPLDFTEAPAPVLGDPPRLEDLDATGLLDTPPEESFDRLTRLASKLLGAPTALMSLVDKERQFFKSQVGLQGKYAKERQTRLSHSFCQWVVSGKEALVVPDANEHPTLKRNLAIRDMGVVAYAGVPLSGRSGQAIGSFCTIDSRAREWTEEELSTLRDLADIAEAYAHLESARSEPSKGQSSRDVSMHVAGRAVLGAAHILRRHGARLAEGERDQLLAIIEEQARHLAGPSGD